MNFADLYRFANELDSDYTPVEKLRHLVKKDHPTIHDVKFWACDLDQGVSLGHMVLELDRSSPYDDPFIVASVRFDRGLDRSQRRFVCCKELMHVFDKTLERTSNRDLFLKLMDELENNPIAVDRSPMFESERNAEWMAILALCPQRLRARYLPPFLAERMSARDVAKALRLPENYVKAIMGDGYLRILEALTGESVAPTSKVKPAMRPRVIPGGKAGP